MARGAFPTFKGVTSEPDLTWGLRGEGVRAGARNLKGQFQSLQVEVAEAHARMARNVALAQQAALAKAIQANRREQRPTRFLEYALVDPENRRASGDGFIVGIPAFLDSSRARAYYRDLEGGSVALHPSIHIGQRFVGFWVTGEAQLVGPVRGGKNALAFIGARAAGVAPRDAYRWRIHEPIPAYRYMLHGWEAWKLSGDQDAQYARALQKFGSMVRFTTSRGNVAARRR